MKTHLKRLLSGMLSMVMTVSAIPIVSAHAEESIEPYPYTMFAASDAEGAITVNAGNFCVNGNVATNGTIVSSGNMNVNGARTENAAESMIFIFDKIDYQYFSSSNVDEHEEDYVLEELNINLNVPTEVMGETTLTGNVNINSALKAMEDINLFGEVKNTNDSIIFSKYGDIVIDSQNVNLNGLVYAPFGTVDITSQNLNLNNVVIIADSIILNCPNINANNSSNMSSFVGNVSEGLDIPVEEWVYMKDENENGLPDYFEASLNDYTSPNKLYTNTRELKGNSGFQDVYFYILSSTKKTSISLKDAETGEEVAVLVDNGHYATNGDDIMGDGVYSGIVKFDTTTSDDYKQTFYAEIDDDTISNAVEINVILPFSEDELSNMEEVRKAIGNVLKEYATPDDFWDTHPAALHNGSMVLTNDSDYTGIYNSRRAALENVLNDLANAGKINQYEYVNNENTYYCEYTNGIPFVIIPSDLLDPELLNPEELTIVVEGDYSGYDAVLLNSFEDKFYRSNFYEKLVKNWENEGMTIEYDDDVTVIDIETKLANKDIIALSGHGMVYWGHSVFCLQDEAITTAKDLIYSSDLKARRVEQAIYTDGTSFYMATADLIRYYYGSSDLNGSFVFSESCCFMGETDSIGHDESFADAFIDCSAEAVVGFENSVFIGYSRKFMVDYFENLLDGKSAIEAFNHAKNEYGEDDHDGVITSILEFFGDTVATPYLVGDESAVLSKDLKNGNWESSDQIAYAVTTPCDWSYQGDVRVLTELGDVAPYGSRMAFLSTGIGASSGVTLSGSQGSTLSQVIRNIGKTTLEFEYDFISEEPMEYVGSSYDDKFEVQILSTSGTVLYSEIIESVNKSTWYAISSINFDGGDSTTYHTKWKSKSIDISPYIDQTIEIKFLVYDVGDSKYDSAVVLDNIVCN